jgi:hypothetical protein
MPAPRPAAFPALDPPVGFVKFHGLFVPLPDEPDENSGRLVYSKRIEDPLNVFCRLCSCQGEHHEDARLGWQEVIDSNRPWRIRLGWLRWRRRHLLARRKCRRHDHALLEQGVDSVTRSNPLPESYSSVRPDLAQCVPLRNEAPPVRPHPTRLALPRLRTVSTTPEVGSRKATGNCIGSPFDQVRGIRRLRSLESTAWELA